ncbi:VOC family protein [Ramlibacter ginsenosidimutans]|uniref:VOC family protein n=1 Tax=Ramlibacter ginsenosidimutans TaxID=502333 RepID=A0A934WJC0_9BURK|nr:VOC family protein [Ramlibacter ginsenosidimutans]MBK6004504.1 VOC family protein [Ramlibacter ginsenosidimutans]
MLRIREIDHLVLRVRDVDAMIRFYGEVLGCPVHRIDEKIRLVQLRAGRGLIDLIPVDSELGRAGGAAPGREGRNLDHFCLRVDPWDADAIGAHLRAHGVEPGPVAQRFGAEGQGPSLYLSDPEGNTVELKGPPVGSAD